jgi:hypothetical protein
MKDHTPIDQDNLKPFAGRKVQLYCQVGVMLDVEGSLVIGSGLSRYGCRLASGTTIGFGFGSFKELENGTLRVIIS